MSELNREQFEAVVELTDSYLRGDLGAEGFAQLQAMLVKSPAAAQAAIQYLAQAGMMREVLSEQSQPEAAAAGPELREYLAILHDLEPTGPLPAVVIHDPLSSDAHGRQGQGNFAMRAFAQPWFWIGAGAAAVFAVAVTLAVVFSGNSTPTGLTVTTPRYAPQSTPEQRDSPAANVPVIVATLTGTHNATWAEQPAKGASAPGEPTSPPGDSVSPILAPGDALYSGTRLTLTTGFAEITTHSGAFVTLEAPATIEMLDSENALHLHEGKLVGICESESSKGFIVYTPTARITDLGTRFGAEVGKDKSTRTAVFDGEVELTARSVSPAEPSGSVRLTAGWSSGVSSLGVLDREPKPLSARDHARFAHRIEDGMDPRFAYRRAVLSAEPLVYWGFDEANEQTRNLAGSDAFDGRAMGQTSYAKGLFGSALQLNGDIQSMGGVASMSPLDFNEVRAFTLEAWCWIDRPHYGRVVALAALDSDQIQPPMHLSMVEVIGGDLLSNIAEPHRDSVRFLHRNPPSFESVEGTNWFTEQAPPVGQWVHLVVVKDDQEARIYINGELTLRANDTQPAATEYPLGLFVGVSPIMLRPELSSSPRDFRPFHGLIDEVAVYDTALTTQTIQHHFSLGRPSEGG